MKTSWCGFSLWVMSCLLLLGTGVEAQFADTYAEAYYYFGGDVARGNFNCDRYQDLAVGVPGEGISNGPVEIAGAGAVEVIYGTSDGLDTAGRQFWRQGNGGVNDMAETNDVFGSPLATGDFNDDGCDDLAIGVSYEDVGSIVDAGAVNVIYGSASGLSTAVVPDQFWHQNSNGVDNVAEQSDLFGGSLTTGDFNADGYDDLAIGARFESVGNTLYAGAVNVLYGSASGLSATAVPDQFWHQNSANVQGVAGFDDHFGTSLSAGHFNADIYEDLAIGVPNETIGTNWSAGAVNVIYGSATGLSATFVPDQLWHQDRVDVEDVAEIEDSFGLSVAAGDFNGDGRDDLSIGVPYEDVGAGSSEGAVNVVYGSPGGLSATFVPDQLWHQDSAFVEDVAEYPDNFGMSLAAGDFNDDGDDDLAIGVIHEGVGSVVYAGAVNVIYGSAGGLSPTGALPDQFWHQDSTNVEDVAESSDLFGFSLAAGDFNGDGRDDLAIGSWEDLFSANGNITDAGSVNVLYAWTFGLSASAIADQFWKQTVVLPPQP
jgi:hypothetical protein